MRIISSIVDWVSTPYTIFFILKDPSIQHGAKIRAVIGLVLIFAYVISPFDMIPDFIPAAGWLDDLVVVPLGLALLRKITPGINVVEKTKRAQASVQKIMVWTMVALSTAILLGLAWLGVLIYLIVRLIAG